MTTTTAKAIARLKQEVGFIGRQAQRIEGSNSDDFEALDAIGQAVQVALSAILELELDAQDATDEAIAA